MSAKRAQEIPFQNKNEILRKNCIYHYRFSFSYNVFDYVSLKLSKILEIQTLFPVLQERKMSVEIFRERKMSAEVFRERKMSAKVFRERKMSAEVFRER